MCLSNLKKTPKTHDRIKYMLCQINYFRVIWNNTDVRAERKKEEQRNGDGERQTKISRALMWVQWFVIGEYRTCILRY